MIAVALLVAIYVGVFSATSILTFRNFGMSAFDIGIHIQAIWKLSTGGGLFNTVRGLNIWGDHCWFIMVPYAPLYWLIPRVETLLVLQSCALAAGAFPLASLLQRRSAGNLAVLIFALAWLLSPALQNMNLENFHPEVLAAPFLLWAIERADGQKWLGYWIAVGFAILCKEDVALTTFMIGAWVFFRHRRIGALTMLLSIAWFLLCMKVFLPFFNGEGFFRFEGAYWFSEFWESKFDPGYYWSTLAQGRVGKYALQLSLPLLFLFLLSPVLTLAALPSFMVNVLSGIDYLISIDYHYNFQTLPVLFAAAALGYSRLHNGLRRSPYLLRAILASVLILSLWCNDRWSQMPLLTVAKRLTAQYAYLNKSGKEARFRRFEELLPLDPDAEIAVSHNLLPHLAHRNSVYMFPNPFKPKHWGINGENLPSPDGIEALFLDSNALDADGRAIIRRLLATDEFIASKREGSLLLAFRGAKKSSGPIEDPLALEPSSQDIRLLVYLSGDNEVRSLTSVKGATPDLDISTREMRIHPTGGRLQSAEGLDLGGHDNMRLVFLGQWEAKGKRPVTFRIKADDGCGLYIDGAMITDYDGVHSYRSETLSQPLQLEAGSRTIALDYFEWGGEAGMQVEWAEPGGEFKLLEAGQTLP